MVTSSAVPPIAPSADDRAMPYSVAGRCLCAGTYLDREFRGRVLRDVYSARNKRAAPSHGFDVVPVLRHAWRAWCLETGQYLLTLAVLAAGLAIVPLDTVIAVDVLVIWRLLRLWLRWVKQFIGYGEPLDSPALDELNLVRDRRLRLNGRVLKYALWFSSGMLLVLLLAAAAGGRPGSVPARLAGTGLGAAAITAALAAVVALVAGARAVCLARSQSAARRGRRLSRRMRSIDEQQHHPFVVHMGHKPFIGSGKLVRSWSFAQRLVRADPMVPGGGTQARSQEFDRLPFPARKLVDRLKDSILDLCRDDEDPETRLRGLRVTDEVFIDETHAGIDARKSLESVLAGDRHSDVVNRAIAEAIANPGDAARHYLAARVESWGGGIVTSVFVHVSLLGRTLYLEFATYALFPVKTEYAVDRTRPWAVAPAVGTALASLPEQLLESWRLIGAPASFLPARCRAGIGTRAGTGAEVSLRETAMVDNNVRFRDEPESSYFQVQDVAQHSKIIERRLIATVEDFLGEVGVDTSEFSRRTMEILNNGIINTGSGDVSIVGNAAVGQNSSVTT